MITERTTVPAVEIWRTIATGLVVLFGLALVLSARVQKLDSTTAPEGAARKTTVAGLVIVAALVALTATVLPEQVCWAVLAAAVFISSILMVAG